MKKIIYILLFAIFLSSCSANSVQEHIEKDDEAENKAQLMAEAVNGLDSVEMAVVALNGDRALVEIEISGELTDERLIPLKSEIEKLITEMDDTIKHVGVTAAPEIISRMAGEKETDFNQSDDGSNSEDEEKVMELTPIL